MLAPAASLLDLTPLTDRAERLVKAARAAGADAADAVAVRTMSLGIEVRDGQTEESERAEGDDLGLRVLVGRRQAMVSTNDVLGQTARLPWPNGPSLWPGQRLRTNSPGSPTQTCWRVISPTSI